METDETPDSTAVDYSRLREGLCPKHGTPLERRDDNGWCDECSMGWSMTPETINVHFDIKSAVLDGRPLGPGRARFERPNPGAGQGRSSEGGE